MKRIVSCRLSVKLKLQLVGQVVVVGGGVEMKKVIWVALFTKNGTTNLVAAVSVNTVRI